MQYDDIFCRFGIAVLGFVVLCCGLLVAHSISPTRFFVHFIQTIPKTQDPKANTMLMGYALRYLRYIPRKKQA